MENLYTPDCIRTFTGLYVNIFDPKPEMFCIEDIAHALSNQCRFGGHLPKFYSVAQHSAICASNAVSYLKLQALMHDASEAYLMDIPSPIKNRLSNYKEIEHGLMEAISLRFEFNWPMDKRVKLIDQQMLEFEWDHIMLQKPLPDAFICFSPEIAKTAFLTSFYQIINL